MKNDPVVVLCYLTVLGSNGGAPERSTRHFFSKTKIRKQASDDNGYISKTNTYLGSGVGHTSTVAGLDDDELVEVRNRPEYPITSDSASGRCIPSLNIRCFRNICQFDRTLSKCFLAYLWLTTVFVVMLQVVTVRNGLQER